MTRSVSVVLALSLGFSSAVSGQQRGPIRAWLESEARQNVAAASAAERSVESEVPDDRSADVGWSRVRRLKPGREITLTIRGLQPASRYLLSADESGITLLNLTDPTLPTAAARALREIATHHREYFEGAAKGGVFLVDNLRLTSAGVFVSDRKVADLQRVVETRGRKEVAEIKTRQKGRGVWGHLGPLGGYFVGGMSGGFVAGFACQATVGRDRCDTGAFLTGMLAGGVAGGVYGFHAAKRETNDVIYRAP